jgi:hypothetical protein
MTQEIYPNPEGEPIPRLRLQEGVDFIDQVELHNRIMDELTNQGRDTDSVLLCGHNQDDNNGQPRMRVYATSVLDVDKALVFAERTPYDEAISVSSPSDTPTITVYDERFMQENMEQGGHETIDGRPVDRAAILEVELSLE